MSNKHKSSATLIPLDQAVGTVLAHDITEIRPGQFKGAAFKKGHIIIEEDLPYLKRVGKEHLFVLHLEPGEIHEDDAAIKFCEALAGPHLTCPAFQSLFVKPQRLPPKPLSVSSKNGMEKGIG